MAERRLSLDAQPDGSYLLSRRDEAGANTHIHLSEADVLDLIQSAPKFRADIFERHNPQTPQAGFEATVATEVVRIGLNHDALRTSLLLTLYAPSGTPTTWALSEDVAAHLAEAIPRWLAKMNDGPPQRKN